MVLLTKTALNEFLFDFHDDFHDDRFPTNFKTKHCSCMSVRLANNNFSEHSHLLDSHEFAVNKNVNNIV